MTILVAVTDDGLSDRVLDVAVDLGRDLDEDLYVVHLTTNESATGDERRLRDELRDGLADEPVGSTVAIEHLGRGGTRSGRAVGRELADLASDTGVTHAVIGYRSKSTLRRLAEGTTAFAVAQGADVPVTVVPEPEVEADAETE